MVTLISHCIQKLYIVPLCIYFQTSKFQWCLQLFFFFLSSSSFISLSPVASVFFLFFLFSTCNLYQIPTRLRIFFFNFPLFKRFHLTSVVRGSVYILLRIKYIILSFLPPSYLFAHHLRPLVLQHEVFPSSFHFLSPARRKSCQRPAPASPRPLVVLLGSIQTSSCRAAAKWGSRSLQTRTLGKLASGGCREGMREG